jgi:hypothetical protein
MRLIIIIVCKFFVSVTCFSQDSTKVKPNSKDSLKYEIKKINEEIKQTLKEIKEREAHVRALKKKIDTLPSKKYHWKYIGNFSVNITETVRGDWAAGGLSNYGAQAIVHLEQDLRAKKHEWDNTFDARFGFIKTFDAVSGVSRPIYKTMDWFQISSKYLYHLKDDRLSVGFESIFISQFTKTYDINSGTYLFSDFLAPGILDLSPGFEYDPFPFLKLFISPFNSRMKFVNNDEIINRTSPTANRYGHDVGEKFTYEMGSKLDAFFEKELLKGFTLRSRFQATNSWGRPSNILDRLYTSRTNIDVNWQTDLYFKIHKFININAGLHLIFDDDHRFSNVENPDPDGKKAVWQVRENLGIGFVFGF